MRLGTLSGVASATCPPSHSQVNGACEVARERGLGETHMETAGYLEQAHELVGMLESRLLGWDIGKEVSEAAPQSIAVRHVADRSCTAAAVLCGRLSTILQAL